MWNKAIRVCSTIMWIIFVWTMGSLVMAVTALPSHFNPTGMIATMVLLTLGVLSYTLFKKHRWIAAVLFTLALIPCIINAVELHEAFPTGISSTGKNAGITGVDLAFKYLTATYAWPFVIAGWLFSRSKYKAEREAEGKDYKGQFDLSGDPIFSDRIPEDDHPQKRSVRARMKKEQESDFE